MKKKLDTIEITNKLNKIIKCLEESKAKDIWSLETSSMSALFDFVVICTASSPRHARMIAKSVKSHANHFVSNKSELEGEKEANWIVVDLGDIVIHVFDEESRISFNLEEYLVAGHREHNE